MANQKPVKTYHLYGLPGGGHLSNQMFDYRGQATAVAAVSIKQAFYYAHNNVWAEDPDNPRGILSVYNRLSQPDTKLWTGVKLFGGQMPEHMASKRQTIAWMHEVEELTGD